MDLSLPAPAFCSALLEQEVFGRVRSIALTLLGSGFIRDPPSPPRREVRVFTGYSSYCRSLVLLRLDSGAGDQHLGPLRLHRGAAEQWFGYGAPTNSTGSTAPA